MAVGAPVDVAGLLERKLERLKSAMAEYEIQSEALAAAWEQTRRAEAGLE